MFTGLVQAVGTVTALTRNAFGVRLVITPGAWDYTPNHGDSISVSGCCLTYAPKAGDAPGSLPFDVITTTLEKTKLGSLSVGSRVNLESCLTPSSHIGGHFVQGHVDATAKVHQVVSTADQYRVTIAVDDETIRYIVPTGSIAVDGVSLTVADVNPAAKLFTVALIPTTLQLTTLGDLKAGDPVNIEVDVLVKAAVHYLRHFSK
jgi:riboflavin synthase